MGISSIMSVTKDLIQIQSKKDSTYFWNGSDLVRVKAHPIPFWPTCSLILENQRVTTSPQLAALYSTLFENLVWVSTSNLTNIFPFACDLYNRFPTYERKKTFESSTRGCRPKAKLESNDNITAGFLITESLIHSWLGLKTLLRGC